MADYTVEKEWVARAGLRCAAIRGGGASNHRCGYVAVKPEHALYGVKYDKQARVLGKTGRDWNEDQEFASPEEKLNVHGGITYAREGGEYPVVGVDEWWFGFDCMHHRDIEEGGRSLEYVVNECEKLARQLAEIKPLPEMVEIRKADAEELVEYLGKKQTTGGQFPMETWRAEADGVEHLLAALREAME